MILVEKRNDGVVTNIAAADSSSFSMIFDAKMFATLSDSLYQNKPGSIIREISCNALDSHIGAGKSDVPFQIHLPSTFEPYLSVKDFGMGMDHDDVTKIFTCIGRSTKEASNDSVGAFGLGSKTPFSYTDMFTVIAIKDGISRTYSMYKNEDGMPMLSLMGGENPTTEGNGVEVIIPINNINDRTMFAREIAHQLHFFPVRPTIIGGDHSVYWMNEPTEADVLVRHNNIKTFKSGDYRKGCIVVMGPVGYELNFELLKAKMPNHAKMISWLTGKTARIYFNIGDICVTPSRETLDYNNKTLRALAESFNGYVEEVTRVFNEQLSGFNSALERAKFIYECNDDIGNIVTISSTNEKSILKYSGRFAYFDGQTIMTAMDANACPVSIFSANNILSKKAKTIGRVSIHDFLSSSMTVVVEDDCKHAKRRLNTLQSETARAYKETYVVVPNNRERARYVYEAFKDAGITVKYLSEYTPSVINRDYSSIKTHGYYIAFTRLKDAGHLDINKTRSGDWTKITDKTDIEPAFFVSSDRGNVYHDGFIEKYRSMITLGIIPESHKLDVYAFPLKVAAALDTEDGWIDLKKYMNTNFNPDTIKKLYQDVWESSMYVQALERLRSTYSSEISILLNIKEIKDWAVDLELTLFDKTELAASYSTTELANICKQMPYTMSRIGVNIIFEYIEDCLKKIREKIPLLNVFSYGLRYISCSDKERQAFYEYVEMYIARHGQFTVEPIDLAEIEKRLTVLI